MSLYRMRYFLCISLAWIGCTSSYKGLREVPGDPACVQQFRPALGHAVYRTEVDVIGKHLGGLLAIKAMEDSSTRLVFTSEMGLTYFDFSFLKDGTFRVNHIIDNMNRKAVIKTLRKDFELILLEHTAPANGRTLSDGKSHYYAFPQEKGVNYYITDTLCTTLTRVEKASKTKPIVVARMMDYRSGVPDSISIVHTQFSFTITLKKLNSDAPE